MHLIRASRRKQRSALTAAVAAGITEVDLERQRPLLLPDQAALLVCLEGELWLTRDRDNEDYILGPGQQFAIRPGDQATVQALRESRLRLVRD